MKNPFRARLAVRILMGVAIAHCVPVSRAQLLDSPQTDSASHGHAGSGTKSVLGVADLRCESTIEPLFIDSPAPRLSWQLQSLDPAARGLRQTAYRILVATSPEDLSADRGDMWDSRVESSRTFNIEYAGSPLQSNRTYYWKVKVWDGDGEGSGWSKPASFTMGLLQPSDWKAKWIGSRRSDQETSSDQPLPIFRRGFDLDPGVKRATARVSGLGQYELRINGSPVNDGHLLPAWTDYRKRVFYDTYDVTSLLRPGQNAIAVLLGNGMYNVPETPGRYQKFTGSLGKPKLLFQLSVTYEDGRHVEEASDASWKWNAGPITFSSVYGGEDFDARLEPRGWDQPGFNDQDWQPAAEVSGPGGAMQASAIPEVRVMQEFPAVHVTEPRPGVRVYDLGQNFSGWPKIQVHGQEGSSLKLVPGELLDKNGFVSQQSSGSPVWFSYVLRGGSDETWHPRFTYYGFRYVQVEVMPPAGSTSATSVPDVVGVEGEFVHSSASRTGNFSTSSMRINSIHHLILAAMDSNLQSVITDCPHREKLGWLEQTHLLGRSLMYNYDVSQLYRKLADDMQGAQLANGLVPDLAPEYVKFEKGFRDSPEWGSASILALWATYQHYGDRGILSSHFDMMRRYADYLRSSSRAGILSYGLGDWYDVGPGEPGESKLTTRGLTATAIYYQDLEALHDISAVLGHPDLAREYAGRAAAVRASFNKKMFHAGSGTYDSGSQTANGMPLALNLVPPSRKSVVVAHLVEDIRKRNNHVSAGEVGFHYVVKALLDAGKSDVLVDMLARDDAPSYGYQLAHGATSLTEAWDSNPNSSQNHFMLGHIEDWFHRGLAGINLDLSLAKPRQIVIAPYIDRHLTWVSDTQDTVLGTIASEWKRQNGTVSLVVKVPPNSTATIHVPTAAQSTIKEGGRALAIVSTIRRSGVHDRSTVLVVDSGEYQFEWPE
jgi:alpha-L-rhamnosidase